MMDLHESELREALKDVARLKTRIEKLETIYPPGSAKKVFEAFWQEHGKSVTARKELAAMAFDAGHQMRHRKQKGT